ncbi:hypothetical protein ANTPLA_LOCUS2260 [Anthophora plagiata]
MGNTGTIRLVGANDGIQSELSVKMRQSVIERLSTYRHRDTSSFLYEKLYYSSIRVLFSLLPTRIVVLIHTYRLLKA